MKKVSKIIALSLAIMMISGVAVFASEITSVTGSGTPEAPIIADADITVTAVAPTTVDQVTVVVYKGATADENSIAYIDQQPNTTGTVVFTFKMRDAFTAGEYTVKVGGTDVTTANDTAKVNWTGTVVQSYKISGTVTVQGTAPVTVASTVGTASVTGSTVVGTTTQSTYEVTGIPGATDTTLTISAKGHATYAKSVSIVDADVVRNESLLAGDADNDQAIGPKDLQLLFNNWLKGSIVDNAAVDIDNDGAIGPKDLQLVFNNWLKSALANYTN